MPQSQKPPMPSSPSTAPSKPPKYLQAKIFYSIFGLVAGVEIAIFGLFFLAAEMIGQKWAYEHLELESKKLITQMHNTDYLAFWAQYPYRISLITEEGVVIYDNTISAVDLDNHKDREEVQMALASGRGYVERKSTDMLYKALYYASYLPEYRLILRVSMNQRDIYAFLLPIVGYMAILLIITLLLSTIITSYLTRSIIAPLNNLSALDTKKFRAPYRELVPFFYKIIAQRKQLKKQLKIIRRQQQQFQAISQNINEGLVLIDTKKQILSYNTKAKELLPTLESSSSSVQGAPSTDLVQDIFAFIDLFSPQIQTSELQIKGNHIECIALPIWGKLKPKAFVVLLLDRSEKNQIHAMRREFSANVTHELKTPLSVIMASSEMMKQGLIPQKDFMLFFDKIYDECKRLLEIINDILKLSFFDEGGEKLESSVVNVYEVAQWVVCSLAPLAAEKELRVQIICDDQASCTISAVARLLEDMLYNLCENAIKYNNQQGSLEICISIGEFDPRAIKDFTHITPSLALPIGQDTATIMIKDSGIGIPESEQKRVFERFYRVDKSRSKKLGGTGLGLSIVKHIAIYHNAHIFLRSNADLQSSSRGSEILVVFAR
ncbi:ATP-binding protein [Helicobacter canis]|uniref:ATP-binding protein n=1 Tax=Helicobacter canis TaxID=29419 RepID=UPI0026F33311|nr:ATP-binding protein [Helicobacter canis]